MSKIIVFFLLIVSTTFSENLLPFPFIFAEGEADTSVTPDKAAIRFMVTDEAEESIKAKETVEKVSNEIISTLLKLGVKSDNIKAYELSKDIKTDYQSGEAKILGYSIYRDFRIVLSDLNIYDSIAQLLLNMNNVNHYSVTFGINNKESVESDLLRRACDNARKNADQMASSLNAKVKSVFAISKNEFYTIPALFGLDKDFRGSQTNMGKSHLTPSTINMHGKIFVIFKM